MTTLLLAAMICQPTAPNQAPKPLLNSRLTSAPAGRVHCQTTSGARAEARTRLATDPTTDEAADPHANAYGPYPLTSITMVTTAERAASATPSAPVKTTSW